MRWQTIALAEVVKIERDSVSPDQIADGTRYLGLEHIETGGKILAAQPVANGDLASNKFAFCVKHVLYGKLRPYLAKIALPDFAGVCSTDILPIRPGPYIDRRYLAYFLRLPSSVEFANNRSTGANLPRLSPKALAELPIPLPPLDEQKRIAAILDQADALRRLRRRALDRLNGLGQAIFHAMFSIRLNISNENDLKPLGDFCEVRSGSTPSRKETSNFGGNISWVKTSEVNGQKIFNTEENVTENGVVSARLKIFPENTVLVAMYGQGKTRGQVGILGIPATTNQACAAIVCKPMLHPTFLFYQLKMSYNRLRELGQGGNQPNLNAGMIKSFPIILPKFPQQIDFVRRIENIDSNFSLALNCIDKHDDLFTSLQHCAFRGEL